MARSYTRTSLFGEFTGRVVGTTLGSANCATPTIANTAQVYDVAVTTGSTSLRATIGNRSDHGADLDLFVHNRTSTTSTSSSTRLLELGHGRQRASTRRRVLERPCNGDGERSPAAGRVVLGNVPVRTDANVLIGQGDVVIESVLL